MKPRACASGLLLAVELLLVMAASGADARAQSPGMLPALWHASPAVALPVVGPHKAPWAWRAARAPFRVVPQQLRSPAPAFATAFSAVLPGAGQHLLGQRRGWAYLALEAVGWALYIDRHSDGGDIRNDYRDFAWDRARSQSAVRIDGDFGYYETLSKWERSGQFDVDPQAPGVQPESDAAAFNGRIWSLATQLFLPGGGPVPENDPKYQAALAFYRERAFASNFLWDWTGTGSAQKDFGGLIRKSDERFRQAKNVAGAIIANHIVSAVDAYLSARGAGPPVRARIVPDVRAGRTGWLASLSIATHE